MSQQIQSVVIDGILDKRLLHQNFQAARLIDIGSSWTQLRMGVRFAVDDTGASLTGTPRMYFGLLSSPAANMANGPLTAVTSHFLGLVSPVSTWTRSTTSPSFVRYSASQMLGMRKRVGSTETTIASFGYAWVVPAAPTTHRGALILEVTKASPYNMEFIRLNSSAGVIYDVSYDLLTRAMEAEDMDGARDTFNNEVTNYDSTNATVAVDEATDGELNAVCMAWNRSSPVWYWSEILWRKIS